MTLHPLRGSYLLVLAVDRPLAALPIGKLGCFNFPVGYYLYVGSAFGSGGLPARLAYHQRRNKPHPHWHIDHLRPHTHLLEAWTFATECRLECVWCSTLAAAPGFSRPVRGFGSRDTGCTSHLFYTPRRPPAHHLTSMLLNNLPLSEARQLDLLIEVHLFEA